MNVAHEHTQYFRFVERVSGGGHVQVKVFAGTTPGSLGCCGGLVMRLDEWETLRRILHDARIPQGLDARLSVDEVAL